MRNISEEQTKVGSRSSGGIRQKHCMIRVATWNAAVILGRTQKQCASFSLRYAEAVLSLTQVHSDTLFEKVMPVLPNGIIVSLHIVFVGDATSAYDLGLNLLQFIDTASELVFRDIWILTDSRASTQHHLIEQLLGKTTSLKTVSHVYFPCNFFVQFLAQPEGEGLLQTKRHALTSAALYLHIEKLLADLSAAENKHPK
ncbi:hypothetical protein TNCV_4697291 [Trichonephila clavipes]|nr:hypothetical protein TNCV_4697291 [Trichonephila clavipes]